VVALKIRVRAKHYFVKSRERELSEFLLEETVSHRNSHPMAAGQWRADTCWPR
jgi:hypothetical protein